MRETGLPFDDIKNLVQSLPAYDGNVAAHTRSQLDELGLGESDQFCQICEWYSGWSGRSPAVHRGIVTLFAGTHEVDNARTNGSSAQKVLKQVESISAGGAILNRLCHQHDLGLKVFDLALQLPVADITVEAALDERSCAGTIAFGMEAIAGGADLLCIAALEPEITTSSIAILTVLHKLEPDSLAKVFDVPLENIESAIAQVKGHENNPLEVLRRLGGRETAALCGAILAARSQHIPVVLNGYSALAAASILSALNPASVKHCIFAHASNGIADNILETIGVELLLPNALTNEASNNLAVAGGLVKSACLLLQGQA